MRILFCLLIACLAQGTICLADDLRGLVPPQRKVYVFRGGHYNFPEIVIPDNTVIHFYDDVVIMSDRTQIGKNVTVTVGEIEANYAGDIPMFSPDFAARYNLWKFSGVDGTILWSYPDSNGSLVTWRKNPDGSLLSLITNAGNNEQPTVYGGQFNTKIPFGREGKSFAWYMGEASVKGLTVNARGWEGERGAKGQRGRNGTDAGAACETECTDGHVGYRGGPGSQGGKGGKVEIEYLKQPSTDVSIRIDTLGGLGGRGGAGGDGGEGGGGRECNLILVTIKRGSCNKGPSGDEGDRGPNGAQGQESRTELSMRSASRLAPLN